MELEKITSMPEGGELAELSLEKFVDPIGKSRQYVRIIYHLRSSDISITKL